MAKKKRSVRKTVRDKTKGSLTSKQRRQVEQAHANYLAREKKGGRKVSRTTSSRVRRELEQSARRRGNR